ncbi:lysozyme [Neorhizobium sp. P12A]|uniref:peptidoglycan-binding protein n=1 Tax=Neorhizobium sp. P12A TaxID=2268027 RepID=UPI0011EE584A|nr:peptidoglycan-binding protein [Neorhizobium sp. P12A]KAA0685990.1 lysozyme [Neorhizobium sp. P12A]
MRLSPQGAADVRLHEGFVDHAYGDPGGVLTIGTGFTWASAAFRQWWAKNRPGKTFGPGSTMTRAESDECLMLASDIEYGAAVNKFLGGKSVPQNVFDASDSVVFNCGAGALAWKWAIEMKAGDYHDAASLLRNTATTQNGKTLAGLIARRKDEAILLETGKYASGGQVTMPTAEEVNALSDGVLERGERGSPVMQLQQRLAALGYKPGAVDGIFGYGTESAVIAFQKASKLTTDGKAGPITLAALAA